jgi:hypothetical protein
LGKRRNLTLLHPLEQLLHWNGYDHQKFLSDDMLRFYTERLPPFAMYRGSENLIDWDDAEEKLGSWT